MLGIEKERACEGDLDGRWVNTNSLFLTRTELGHGLSLMIQAAGDCMSLLPCASKGRRIVLRENEVMRVADGHVTQGTLVKEYSTCAYTVLSLPV